jgi:hypothetical protein
VDVLAHDVGRRAHLEVVELVDVRVRFVCWNVMQSFVLARKKKGSGARVPF